MTSLTPCLWFAHEAEEAARFYVSLLPDSRIDAVQKSPSDTPAGGAGGVLMVSFTLAGRPWLALNGGMTIEPSLAVSLSVSCPDQETVDRLWERLGADGGTPQKCGWIRDRFGKHWQIVPAAMAELLSSPDREKAGRVMRAMLGMTKLDIAALRRAGEGEIA